ncbi:MAG: hypothetical protein ACRCST_16085 [Turicibacter sp.]
MPIEWDNASYERKYYQTNIFFKVNGIKKQGYVSGINKELSILREWNQENKTYPTQDLQLDYYHYPSAWYYSFRGNPVLIYRRPIRNFKLGVSSTSHYFTTIRSEGLVEGNQRDLNLTLPDKYDINKSIESFGPINSRLALSKDKVFYLAEQIGIRNKLNFVLQTDHFKQEINDALRGNSCQFL